MRLNFKKISAIATSTLMVGMTAGIAAAANYPAPFVESGVGDVAVVYGTGQGAADMAAATNLNTDLSGSVTGGTVSVTDGDIVTLERDPTNFFNLGENMDDFYTSLDEEELSVVLAKGTYTNDLNDEFDFEQKIVMGNNLDFEAFKDSDFNDDTPTLGFKQASGNTIMTYTLSFTPTAAENTVALGAGTSSAPDNLETTTLTLLGKEYYISNVDWTANGVKMTLLDTANSAILNEGETITVNGKEVSLNFIGTDEVKFTVDGQLTNSLAEGSTYKLPDGTYIGVKDILVQDYQGGTKMVEFSIGSGNIILENTLEVTMNSDYISDIEEYEGNVITAAITNSSTTSIDTISLAWILDDDAFLKTGDSWTLPGFESVKVAMGDFIVPTEEVTQVTPDGDDSVKLVVPIKEGQADINLVYLNTGSTSISGLGEKATHKLVTNGSGTTSTSPARVRLNETENSYFVATWISGDDAESYAFEIGSITEGATHTNQTTIRNLVSGASDKTFSEVGDDVDVGQMSFNLTASDDDTGMVTIDISATSGTVYTERLVTAEGMQIKLPYATLNNTAGVAGDGWLNTGLLNATGQYNTTHVNATGIVAPISFTLNVTEEDVDGNIASGPQFMINFSVDSAEGIEPLSIVNITTAETTDSSNIYVGNIVSPLATQVMHDKPTSGLNDLDITYHGSESYVKVYVSESSVSLSTDSAGTVLLKDTETAQYSDKNVIVVGGSCINSAAAALVGEGCGEAWTTNTGIGAGQFLIKGYASSSLTSKHAMLVAGYEAADTSAAVDYLMNNEVDTSAEYTGTTSTTSATMVA